MTDFSKAQINSLANHFVGSKIIGCFFHLMQALTKNLAKKTILSLDERKALLKLIRDEVTSKKEAQILPLLKGKSLVKFAKYFKSTWEGRFPPEIWDFYYRSPIIIKYSTNNLIEREFKSLKTAIGTRSSLEHLVNSIYFYQCAKEINSTNKVNFIDNIYS